MNCKFKINIIITIYRFVCIHINVRASLFQNHEVYKMIYFLTSDFLIKEYVETEIYVFDTFIHEVNIFPLAIFIIIF